MSRPPKPLPTPGNEYGPRPGRKGQPIVVIGTIEAAGKTYIQARRKDGKVVNMLKKSFDGAYILKRAAAVIPTPPTTTIRTTNPESPNSPLALILKRLTGIEDALAEIETKLDTTLQTLGLT